MNNYCKVYGLPPYKNLSFSSIAIKRQISSYYVEDNPGFESETCVTEYGALKNSFLFTGKFTCSGESIQYRIARDASLATTQFERRFDQFFKTSYAVPMARNIRHPDTFNFGDISPQKKTKEIVSDELASTFSPSDELVDKILENSIVQISHKCTKYELKQNVTDIVENYFAYLALISSAYGEKISSLTDKGEKRFNAKISKGLVDRLGLDVRKKTNEVLGLLYNQIHYFLSSNRRIRDWGEIYSEHDEIKIKIKDGLTS